MTDLLWFVAGSASTIVAIFLAFYAAAEMQERRIIAAHRAARDE